MDDKDQQSTEKTDSNSTEVTGEETETSAGGVNKKVILVVVLAALAIFSVVAPEAFAKFLDILWAIIY